MYFLRSTGCFVFVVVSKWGDTLRTDEEVAATPTPFLTHCSVALPSAFGPARGATVRWHLHLGSFQPLAFVDSFALPPAADPVDFAPLTCSRSAPHRPLPHVPRTAPRRGSAAAAPGQQGPVCKGAARFVVFSTAFCWHRFRGMGSQAQLSRRTHW